MSVNVLCNELMRLTSHNDGNYSRTRCGSDYRRLCPLTDAIFADQQPAPTDESGVRRDVTGSGTSTVKATKQYLQPCSSFAKNAYKKSSHEGRIRRQGRRFDPLDESRRMNASVKVSIAVSSQLS